MGTGFAQPKITGDLVMISTAGSKIVPKGSIWARGLRVSRPAYLAVLSPNQYAMSPWEYSCTTTAKRNITADNKINSTPPFRLRESLRLCLGRPFGGGFRCGRACCLCSSCWRRGLFFSLFLLYFDFERLYFRQAVYGAL